MKKGLFITFEGCEGSGKTTQAELLFAHLQGSGYECVLTHEPGGTVLSEKIREILLHASHTSMKPLTELFLYLASRAQHTEEVILPALARDCIVISDRYADSSLAYQGIARELSTELVQQLNDVATRKTNPDLTFLIDIEPAMGLSRLEGKDRIENEEIQFHTRVRNAYLGIAAQAADRIRIIDGNREKEEIAREILEITKKHPWFADKLMTRGRAV
jgi:dTMP kinase